MNFNKACELEDFATPDLVAIIRDLNLHELSSLSPEFPQGHEHRKDWEMAMAVRTLRDFGALEPQAVLLGVAAGSEHTLFYLTRHVRQVFATDRYFSAEEWAPDAPVAMLVEPELRAPFPVDRNRLVVQHMDARELRYPDDTFDGIFSSGSIEHVGDLDDVAHAAYEMGRVLRPGGTLSLSTELLLSGPPGQYGWPGQVLFFTPETLSRYIIDASGLVPVDPLRTEISEATLATRRDIAEAIEWRDIARRDLINPPAFEHHSWQYPHLVMVAGGYVFCSVHLALRKDRAFPATKNAWARPTTQLHEAISTYNLEQIAARTGPRAGSVSEDRPEMAPAPVEKAEPQGVVAASSAPAVPLLSRVPELNSLLSAREPAVAEAASRLDLLPADLGRLVTDVTETGTVLTRAFGDLSRLTASLGDRIRPDPTSPVDRPEAWVDCTVQLERTPPFTVVADAASDDPIGRTYLAHQGHTLFPNLIDLMLSMTAPGDWILDVGAHLGSFALAAAAAGRGVIAVEASPMNASLLRASVHRNGFHSIFVIEAAAADAPGSLPFLAQGAHGHLAASPSESSIDVPAIALDDLVDALATPYPSFIKLDIEGAEPLALRGLRRLLTSPQSPALLYEVNCHTLSAMGSTPTQLVTILSDLGYVSYLVADPQRLIHFRPQDFQPQTEADHLAVRARPEHLHGWTIEPPLSNQARIDLIVDDCRHDNVHHRISIAKRLEHAPAMVLDHPRLEDALRQLRADPDPRVRAAAAWSS